jgi:hypothetical protein
MQLHNHQPAPQHPVIDYLVFVLPWACDPLADHKTLFNSARQRINDEIEMGFCTHAYVKRGRYRFAFRIPVPGGSKPIVWIGALDPVRQKGGIAVSMNPARFAPGDAAYFHEVMERIVGRSYRGLLRHALLNRVDFAVDIVHADLGRMLVSYSGAQQGTVFGKTVSSKGIVETYNFGSEKSDYMTAVYDKNIEQRHRAVLAIARNGLRSESLKANFIKQLDQLHGASPVVRVEVRGKKLNGIPPRDLHKLKNRFTRFTFADLNTEGATLPKKLEDAFMSLCRDRGVKAALEHYKGTPDVRKVNAFWRSHRADWWQPEMMWERACAALRRTGIFPIEVFDAEGARRNLPQSTPVAKSEPRSSKAPHRTGTPVTFTRTAPNRPIRQLTATAITKKTLNRIVDRRPGNERLVSPPRDVS